MEILRAETPSGETSEKNQMARKAADFSIVPGLKFSRRTSLSSASFRTSLDIFSGNGNNTMAEVHVRSPLLLAEIDRHTLPRFINFSQRTDVIDGGTFLLRPRLRNHGLTPSTSSSLQTRNGSPM
jgi:hypothetical protein